jgi:predicted acetyltransferase
MFLVEPNYQYKDSFLAGLHEFQQEGLLLNYNLSMLEQDFSLFLAQTRNEQDPTRIPPDTVPSIRYWLIDNDLFVGNLSIRPKLNAFMLKVAGHIGYQVRPSLRGRGYGNVILRLGVQKAHTYGISPILVTCDETNIASKKVIEYNGGRFENAVTIDGSPIKKLRYWIS